MRDKNAVLVQITKLQQKIQENTLIAEEAMRAYSVLTDQYMNGNIVEPIGKEQARLKRIYDKALRQVEKDRIRLNKLLV